jgi:hypothetical protein
MNKEEITFVNLIENGNFNEVNERIWKNINNIEFGTNFNRSLETIKFPDLLKSITFQNNYKLSLTNVNFPDYVLLKIKLTCKKRVRERFTIYENLPVNLKSLWIEQIEEPLLNLPVGLDKLHIINDKKEYLKQSKIPFGCQVSVYPILFTFD